MLSGAPIGLTLLLSYPAKEVGRLVGRQTCQDEDIPGEAGGCVVVPFLGQFDNVTGAVVRTRVGSIDRRTVADPALTVVRQNDVDLLVDRVGFDVLGAVHLRCAECISGVARLDQHISL